MSAPTRESVLREYGTTPCAMGYGCTHSLCAPERKMADEIVRLRTLADDEKAVDRAAKEFWYKPYTGYGECFARARAALRAALGGAP